MTRLEYRLEGIDVVTGADFMVLDGEQVILLPEDLPQGCEMIVGTKTR